MKSLGTALIIFGVLLSLFDIAGCESDGRRSTLTDWIGNWGEGTAWLIRIGFIVIGIVLLMLNNRKVK